jgi:putative transposase
MGEQGPTMKRRRHTPEQVIRKLREADRLLAEGKTTVEVARQLEVSENTYHRWRNEYGGMKARRQALEGTRAREPRLKRIVADQALENQGLREIAKGRMFLLRMKIKGAWTNSLWLRSLLVVRVTVS